MNWSQSVRSRAQLELFPVRLDDLLGAEDEMRLFDLLLSQLDWSVWEASYERRQGQPPLHPRLVAGSLLYGLLKGLRSSRQLERACVRWIDLIWFLEGRAIDHSTFCKFRQRFASQLEELFEQVARLASRRFEDAGKRLAVDGTTIRANSDRRGARTACALRQALESVAQQRQKLLAALDHQDVLDEACEALQSDEPQALRRQLEQLQSQEKKLAEALAVAEQRDRIKRANFGKGAPGVRVPLSDPQSHVLPNKDGGYAPNWTATAAVDLASGIITDARVVDGCEESAGFETVVRSCEQVTGQTPEAILADGNFVCGSLMKELRQHNVQLYAPIAPTVDPIVQRADLTQPVAPEVLEQLPMSGQKHKRRLSRSAFIYEAQQDLYYCPQGRKMRLLRRETRHHKNHSVQCRQYVCTDCDNCPLADRCLSGRSRRRTIARDEHQSLRDELAQRMSHTTSRQLYRKRAPSIEGVFGFLKQTWGIRQFFYRGKNAVQREWQWICTAYNISKLLRRTDANPLAGPPRRRKTLLSTFCPSTRWFTQPTIAMRHAITN